MSSPVISVTRLKRSFKSGSEDIAVLKDISLTVNRESSSPSWARAAPEKAPC